MSKHGFKSIAEFKGASLPYFTTHTDLVAKQRAAVQAKKEKVRGRGGTIWRGGAGARARERRARAGARTCACARGRSQEEAGAPGASWPRVAGLQAC